MPNTNPIIDNVSTLDFIKRRARDKSIIKIYPLASLTKNILGKEMCEFGLLKLRGPMVLLMEYNLYRIIGSWITFLIMQKIKML